MIGLIITVIAGAVIGWIASIIMKTNAQMGTIANIVCGIVGALVGGFVADLLHIGGPRGAGFSVPQFLIGIVGACIVIAIYKAVTGAGNRVA